MNTYEITAVVTSDKKLIIPAPLDKVGARLRLTVNWEEDSSTISSTEERADSIRRLRGALRNDWPSFAEWNDYKHQIW